MTPTEQLVYEICRRSFLSLWSYGNPRGKESGKELCDVLVVCDPDVVIISVKEITYVPGDDPKIASDRWTKRAIDKSAQQIYGAERILRSLQHVITSRGETGLAIPSSDRLRVHRVAVALGGKGEVPVHFGDLGKGFVHVFDELSLRAVMGELDTIADFVHYLRAKEELYARGVATIFEGGEEDLLALYLHQGRKFPDGPDLLVIGDDLWTGLQQKEEVIARKEANRVSGVWDEIIEWILASEGADEEWLANPRTDGERVMRLMAREDRFARRVLGKSLLEFLQLARASKIRSRLCPSPSGVMYVFLAIPRGEDREYRTAELAARCWVARGIGQDRNPVVGLALDQEEAHHVDLVYLDVPEWSHEHQKQLDYLQSEFGYFVSPRQSRIDEDEYPVNGDTSNGHGA